MEIREILQRNIKISNGLISAASSQVEARRKELKEIIDKSVEAWKAENPKNLSLKQMKVRQQQGAFLQIAVALAHDPSPEPRYVPKFLPSHFVYFSWSMIFLYYAGCIVYIALWIFSRNDQIKQNLINAGNPNPTNAEISADVNAYLLAWLGLSFFSVFISYFVIEPALILIRSAILPLYVRIQQPEKLRDGDAPKPCGALALIFTERNLQRILDILVEVVEALT